MRIRLILYLSDADYAANLENHFKKHFSDKLELYIYSNRDSLENAIAARKADMLVLDEGTAEAAGNIGDKILTAFLVADTSGAFPNEIRKYQKIENIYKILLNLYADRKGNDDAYKDMFRNSSIYTFQPLNGGAGGTTVALACAKSLVRQKKKVFYLNMEDLESTCLYLNTEGSYSLDDVLFALKSRRGNLAMKIESAVRTSADGIDYFYPCKNPYDMKEITAEEIKTLVRALVSSGQYDAVIADQKLCIGETEIQLMEMADRIFWVSDGTEISACKCRRAEEMILAVDKKKDTDLYRKIEIIYNGFSNKSSREISNRIKVFGGFPRYENAGFAEIVDNLSKLDVFKQLSEEMEKME